MDFWGLRIIQIQILSVAMNAITHIRKNVFKLNQREFAAIAGVQQSSVSRWENGHAAPTLDDMARIRKAASDRRIRWSDKLFFDAPSAPAEGRAA